MSWIFVLTPVVLSLALLAWKPGREALLVLYLGGAVLFVVPGSVAGERSVGACEPRANTDPGRLNIAAAPDGYGVIQPCGPTMEFYIARNTPLRSIDAVIRISMPDGEVLATEKAGIDLDRTDYGMFAARLGIGGELNQTCGGLSLDVEIENCRGQGAEVVECPEIRVKGAKLFAGLSVSGESLNVCYDG